MSSEKRAEKRPRQEGFLNHISVSNHIITVRSFLENPSSLQSEENVIETLTDALQQIPEPDAEKPLPDIDYSDDLRDIISLALMLPDEAWKASNAFDGRRQSISFINAIIDRHKLIAAQRLLSDFGADYDRLRMKFCPDPGKNMPRTRMTLAENGGHLRFKQDTVENRTSGRLVDTTSRPVVRRVDWKAPTPQPLCQGWIVMPFHEFLGKSCSSDLLPSSGATLLPVSPPCAGTHIVDRTFFPERLPNEIMGITDF